MTTESDKEFLRNCRNISAAVAAMPLALKFLRANPVLLPPPLGPVSQLGLGVALLMTGLFSLAPRLLKTKRAARRAVWVCTVGGVICLITYLVVISRFTASIERVGHPTAYAVVGAERTEFALKNYPDTTDSELVTAWGHRDIDLDRIYTRSSLIRARLLVALPYIAMLIMIQLFIGAWARTRVT